MASADVDMALMMAVYDGCFTRATVALAAGAKVNGRPGEKSAPIVLAVVANQPAMILLLISHGADPNVPISEHLQHPDPTEDMSVGRPGERALHLAVRSGKVDLVGVLLKQARADPNAADSVGVTPLMATCECQHVCVEAVARLLLEAGADPTLARYDGFAPMHAVALRDHMGLVDVLLSSDPSTLNRCARDGASPLFVACTEGRERMVSKLLALGAMQRVLPGIDNRSFPIVAAVFEGHMDVVRILAGEGGTAAIGGEVAMDLSLHRAVLAHRARILRFLLALDGEKRRSKWANMIIDGAVDGAAPLLHYAVESCYPAAVSVLIEAGADETVPDSEGRFPQDNIGIGLGWDGLAKVRREDIVAIRRMLGRCPAYRARSWAWPCFDDEEDDDEGAGGGGGDGDIAAAATAAAAASALPSLLAVRTFRPTDKKSHRNLFLRNVGRYCAKA